MTYSQDETSRLETSESYFYAMTAATEEPSEKWYVYEDEDVYRVAKVYAGQPRGAQHFTSRAEAEELARRCNA